MQPPGRVKHSCFRLLNSNLQTLAAADHPALRDPAAPFWKEHAPAVFRVKIDSSAGTFTLEVRRDWAQLGPRSS